MTMELPIDFNQFSKNPIAAVAFCMLLAVGYLFYELKTSQNHQAAVQNTRIKDLEEKIEKYEDKLDEVNQKLIECFLVNQNR